MRRIVKKKKSQSGQVLLITIMLLATVITIVLSSAFKATTDTQVSKLEEENQKALAAAESGVEAALKQSSGGSVNIGTINSNFTGTATVSTANTKTTFVSPLLKKDEQYTFYLYDYAGVGTTNFYNGSVQVAYGSEAGANCSDYTLDIAQIGSLTPTYNYTRYFAQSSTNTGSLSDTFDTKDTTNWVYNTYQTVPFSDSGNNVVKNTGTGTDYNGNFYRSSYSITSGEAVQVRFKSDNTGATAHFGLEANDATYRRFAIIAGFGGNIVVQQVDGSTITYPATPISPFVANTYYVAKFRIDDSSNSTIEVYQESNPAIHGYFSAALPTGKSWRFHHWAYTGNTYIDDYKEINQNIGTSTAKTVDGTNFQCSTSPIVVNSSTSPKVLLVRVLTNSGNPTRLGFIGTATLPPQGKTVTSQATATGSNVSKKVVLFQSYPQIPGEFFVTSF